MDLSTLLLYLGVAFLFDATWGARALAGSRGTFVGRFVIAKEERYLEASFGDEYQR